MKLQEIENSLPNGFHDAQVKQVEIDYEKGIAKFILVLWIGDMSSPDESVREKYREAILILKDLIYCVIEAPDPAYSVTKARPFSIDAGSIKDKQIQSDTILPNNLPVGSFAYWIFVNEWNSFIHIAAMDAIIELGNESKPV